MKTRLTWTLVFHDMFLYPFFFVERDPTESGENESDLFDSSDEEETTISAKITEPQVWIVDVDIYLTAFANARKYYEQKKQSAMKQDKTVAASAKVKRLDLMKKNAIQYVFER